MCIRDRLAAALNRLQDLKVASKMKEEYVKMTKKAYNKIHKDFKSDDPKKPRTTKYVPGKGTVSMPVKFVEATLKQAKINIGRDPNKKTCWTGYKAKGTKMKGGKKVPNCVKEFSEWRKLAEKK